MMLSLSAVPLLVRTAQAAGEVFVAPASQPSLPIGSTFDVQVNVSSIDPFDTWDITVKTNASVIIPTSISVTGNIFGSATEFTNCVNGVGTGCSISDTLGDAHSGATSSSGFPRSGSGLLFTITYQVAGNGFSYLSISPDPSSNTILFQGNQVFHGTSEAVYGTPSYTIVAQPASLLVPVDSFSISFLTLTAGPSFSGNVNVTASISPVVANGPTPLLDNLTHTGLTSVLVSLSPGGTNFATLNVTTTPSTPLQAFTVTLNAASGLLKHAIFVSVNVMPSFRLGASPTSLTILAGGSSTSSIALDSLAGFTGNVNVTATVLPPAPGLSISLKNASFTGSSVIVALSAGGTNSATLNVTTTAATPAGFYGVFVTGTSGLLFRTAIVLVSVTFDFTMTHSAIAPSAFIAGGSATSTITLNSLGMIGTVTLATSVSPSAGAPSAVVGDSSSSGTSFVVNLTPGLVRTLTLTVSSTASTAPGAYTVDVTATSGALTKSLQVSVTVSAIPTISSVTVSPTVTATVGQKVTVTVTVVNSGTVTADFTLRVKWGSVTVVVENETLGPGQTYPYQLSWDTTGSGAATNTVSAEIQQQSVWSSSGTGPSYTLAAASTPFFNTTTIAVIGAVVAAVILLSILLVLRRRRATSSA